MTIWNIINHWSLVTMIFSHRYPIVTPGKSNVCWSKTLRSFGGYAVRELFPAIFFRAMWETQCFKTTIWRWLFLPIYNDFGDIFLLGLPWFTVHHIRSSWYTIGRQKKTVRRPIGCRAWVYGTIGMGIRTSHFTISKRVVREPAIPTLAAWFGVKPFPFSLVSSNGRVFLIECIFFWIFCGWF